MNFVVVYRWEVAPGREREFEAAWSQGTAEIRDGCASGGSALFRNDDGSYVAIARWPNARARERCDAAAEAIARMSACVVATLPALHLTAIENLWT